MQPRTEVSSEHSSTPDSAKPGIRGKGGQGLLFRNIGSQLPAIRGLTDDDTDDADADDSDDDEFNDHSF